MGVFAVDLSVFPKEVLEQLHKIWSDENAMEMVAAKVRQEKIAKFYEDNAPRWKDGFGEMVLAVDPYWRDYFRMKYGADADDPAFMKFIGKQTDMFRVKAAAPKTKVGYRGGGGKGHHEGTRMDTKGNLTTKSTKSTKGLVKTAGISNRRERVVYGSR